ncbi:MAG TPA: 16S rRNA (guanine(966)-N(2))-methyltransferase RsmD [Pusillimonas sp.]|jgi:16S rRNA (guanine(966)-N(2))-methyltransferase RsmD|nr:16S rRNA (guanine(966)-N(2))-methyltransferase RsmD [Pusillimonas sp.]|tara:strand:- start:75835 stop:76422 length:588 start_codon:yes stop_codon:yes gene_type:complete
MKKHNIRIVGGVYRRTPIPVIDAHGLRPTPDRIRETLYNWLGYFWNQNFKDKTILDLFAGTGALGFEAASRGAAHVQMVESNPQAVNALRTLRTKLKAGNVRVFPGDAMHVLERTANPFDLILLDPPFGQNWLDRLWHKLPAVLTADGLVYVESENPVIPPANYETLRAGRAGQVHYVLLQIVAPQDNKLQAELH